MVAPTTMCISIFACIFFQVFFCNNAFSRFEFQDIVRIFDDFSCYQEFGVTIGSYETCFKSLEIIYTMTKGGPGISTTTLSYYIYQNAFQLFQMGYAGSVAMTLLAIVGVITAVNFYFKKKWVHYQY